MHLCDDIGDASSFLRGSISSFKCKLVARVCMSSVILLDQSPVMQEAVFFSSIFET